MLEVGGWGLLCWGLEEGVFLHFLLLGLEEVLRVGGMVLGDGDKVQGCWR